MSGNLGTIGGVVIFDASEWVGAFVSRSGYHIIGRRLGRRERAYGADEKCERNFMASKLFPKRTV